MTPTTRAQGLATVDENQDGTPPQDPTVVHDPLDEDPARSEAPTRDPTVARSASVSGDDEDNEGLTVAERNYARLMGRMMNKAITDAIAASKHTASPDPAKYPKAKDPGMFNGRKRRYLRTWIGENEICFRTAPNLYRAATSKVMFAGSFLEGEAKTWFTDYFRDPANVPAFMSDWELFVIELQRNFGLEDELGAAEDDLRKLVMLDKDHATYYTARSPALWTALGTTVTFATNTTRSSLRVSALNSFQPGSQPHPDWTL
jgi:hypothetical protein